MDWEFLIGLIAACLFGAGSCYAALWVYIMKNNPMG